MFFEVVIRVEIEKVKCCVYYKHSTKIVISTIRTKKRSKKLHTK